MEAHFEDQNWDPPGIGMHTIVQSTQARLRCVSTRAREHGRGRVDRAWHAQHGCLTAPLQKKGVAASAAKPSQNTFWAVLRAGGGIASRPIFHRRLPAM